MAGLVLLNGLGRRCYLAWPKLTARSGPNEVRITDAPHGAESEGSPPEVQRSDRRFSLKRYNGWMKLDLMQLKAMHPLLPALTAAEYGHRAAMGLERHDHESGVSLATLIESETPPASLHWLATAFGDVDQLDPHRITEDAAEGITLALVNVARGWVVKRRLPRGEFADWLLQDPEAGLVALEVSGIDEGYTSSRLREKLDQVRRATIANHRVACVVELATPRATMART